MKQTVIIRTTVTVGEEEVDMNLVCDFICDFGEPATDGHPGSEGSIALVEARGSVNGTSMMSYLTADDKSWVQDKAWEIIQGTDICE